MTQNRELATTKELRVIDGGMLESTVRRLPRRRVALLLHPEPLKRQIIREAVSSEFEVVEATTAADGLELLSTGDVDLVIADASFCGKPLLDVVAREGLSGRCVFLSSPSSVNRLIDGFSRGHAFGVVYDTENHQDLKHQIARLVNPRTATRHTASNLILETEIEGRSLACPVVDISNYGCAIWMQARPAQEPLFPGTFLSRIRLTQDGVTLLENTSGVVRHLDVQGRSADGIVFRAGIEFVPAETGAARHAEESVIHDRVVIAASLKAALRPQSAGVHLNAPGFEQKRIHASQGTVEFDSSLLRLTIDRAPNWEPGDVCRAVFELGGTQHVFWSSILAATVEDDATILNLTMPKTLTARRCRNTQRFKPPGDQPVSMSLTCPFQSDELEASAVDITASGVALRIDGSAHLLPIGSLIPAVTLTFPHGARFTGRARVRSLHPIQAGETSALKCGIEFINLHPVERAELADYVVRCVRPEVSSGLDSNFEEIWSFLKESGFLYPEKLKHLNEDEIRKSMSELLDRPNDVFKTWICKVQERIVAHISAIRLFDSTWGVQHLAAAPHRDGLSRARLLNMALTEYCEQHPEIEWVRICYRPTNQWPARVFGTYAQKMVDRELSELRTLSYLVAPTRGVAESTIREITVRPFEPEDLTAIEAYFVSRRRSIQLRSTNISNEGILLDQVNRAYQRFGLFRRREVLVAERRGGLVGFALAEISSPGLNFSELTNTASIHLLEEDPRVLGSLAAATRALYRAAGRDECIVLADEELVPSMLDYGFSKQKEYCCWTWNRSLWRRFYEHSVRAFG
jgi:hypothetical protein